MKKFVLNISVFEVLDQVAKNLRVNDTLWAKAAGLSAPGRISELRLKARRVRAGDLDGAKAVGRAFSVAKCNNLIVALKRICGGEQVSEEIFKLIDTVDTDKEKIILLALTLDEFEDQQILGILKAMKIKKGK
jgi:hypothetical protein